MTLKPTPLLMRSISMDIDYGVLGPQQKEEGRSMHHRGVTQELQLL